MPTPADLDRAIAAAKDELDKARRDGNPTRISRAMSVLDGRLDRKLRERAHA